MYRTAEGPSFLAFGRAIYFCGHHHYYYYILVTNSESFSQRAKLWWYLYIYAHNANVDPHLAKQKSSIST